MQAIFSIKLWIVIIGKLLDAVFPTILILLAFSWKKLKTVNNSPEFRMLLIFLAVISASRFFIFFSGLPYQGRYLYPITISLLPLAALGLNEMILFLRNLKGLERFSTLKITVVLIVAISAINAGKALYFKQEKKWIKDAAAFVKGYGRDGSVKPVILISGVPDVRLAYYSRAEFLRLTFRPETHYIPYVKYPVAQLLKMTTGGDTNLLWLPYYNIYNAEDVVSKIKRLDAPHVFLFIEEKDRELLQMFERENVRFPFKQVAAFKEGRKKKFILYERADR